MNDVVDQILTRLLTERERTLRVEYANTDLQHTLFRIRDLVDADSETDLVELLVRRVQRAERAEADLTALQAVELPEVRAAVSRCFAAVGMTTSGNLRNDAENLARLLEASRAPSPNIL